MKNLFNLSLGWKEVQIHNRAMMRKKSQIDFWLSIIIAFLIIFVITQLLSKVDLYIRSPLERSLSLLSPLQINNASAATEEALKMIQSQDYLQLKPGASTEFTVGYKNTGSLTWKQNGSGKVDIRRKDTYALVFKADLQVNENKPGEIGYYKMKLTAPTKEGSYKYKFLLVRDGSKVLTGSDLDIVIVVTNSATAVTNTVAVNNIITTQPAPIITAVATNQEALKLVQSETNLQMKPGSVSEFTVGYKNNGQAIWKQSASGKVDLRRQDSKTMAYKASLSTKENKPGEIGYYSMKLYAPTSEGTYTFKYVLVRDEKTILSGSELTLVIKVTKNPVQPQLAVNSNTQPATAVTSNVTTKPMGLAEICLSFGKANFKAATIDKLLADECLKIGIKVTDEGTSYINLNTQPVAQTATYPAVQPTPIPTPTPTPTPTTANGPMLRVGLYSTTEPIIITANADYKILDQNKNILASVPAGISATVQFNFASKTYSFTANSTSSASSSYLRFESANSGNVFEIVSLNQRPAWNQTLNDNKYLGTLEIRYAAATSKLWVINEIELESYLKGLAETSNSSPMEYQKALITAARTYAMYHYNRGTKHAAENYTIDATYDQVYKGYNSQIRLTQVSQAVEATRGQVVTYNGVVVVTPYFSYSDGWTRNWEDVWGGASIAWCRSVKEPADYDKTTMYGHGVGMSAHGALHLAANYNYTFDQILKYYYTGIAVQKIY